MVETSQGHHKFRDNVAVSKTTSSRTVLTSGGSRNQMLSGTTIVICIAAAKFLFHVLTAGRYGIFRDELYYLACAEHLDWGYVDQPPLIAFLIWFARNAFGDSLLALRLFPAVAGGAMVMLTGRLAQELGGQRFSQALA